MKWLNWLGWPSIYPEFVESQQHVACWVPTIARVVTCEVPLSRITDPAEAEYDLTPNQTPAGCH